MTLASPVVTLKSRRTSSRYASAVILEPYQAKENSLKLPMSFGRVMASWITSFGVFFICYFLYTMTMMRGISGGDAGELAVSACRLGVAHPPGYPTFTFMYHWMMQTIRFVAPLAATDLPAATLLNLTSALIMSVSIVVLFDSIVALTSSNIVGAVTALMFALNPTVWLYSGQAEVFALHLLFTAMLIRLTIWVFDAPSVQRACFCALISGLSMTNQHTSGLFIFPIAVLLILLERRIMLNWRALLSISICFVIGLLPYAWLPIWSASGALDSWGDLTNLSGFMRHVLRKEYGTMQLGSDEIANSDYGLLVRLMVHISHLFSETFGMFLLLAIPGVLHLIGRPGPLRRAGVALSVALLFYLVVFHSLSNLDMSPLMLGVQIRFWMQPNMIVFVLAGVGWHWFRRRQLGMIVDSVCIGLLAACLGKGLYSRDLSTMNVVQEYGESILQSMPKDALVLLNGDLNNNVVKYLSGCEGRRPDLRLLSIQLMSWDWFIPRQSQHYPDVTFPSKVYHPFKPNGFSMEQFLNANRGKFRIFLCGGWKDGDHSQESSYDISPSGLCSLVFHRSNTNNTSHQKTRHRVLKRGIKSLPVLPPFDSASISSDMWEYIVYRDVYFRKYHLFSHMANIVANGGNIPRTTIALAANLAKIVFETNPQAAKNDTLPLPLDAFRNAGVIFGMYSVHDPDGEWDDQMRRAWTLFLDNSHESDPSYSGIKTLVDQRVNPYRHD